VNTGMIRQCNSRAGTRPANRYEFPARKNLNIRPGFLCMQIEGDRGDCTDKEARNDEPDGKGGPNRLIHELSPYLLQHAFNPVNWYPWGEEAFLQATEKNIPIFLSIGYATCHWCHVMEKESFENAAVAQILNESFVCIKVDREERPDIDHLYMSVCQMMTGSGGWPLTIFMTPDKKPFFAATYIPRENRFGQPGLLDLLPAIARMWNNEEGKMRMSAESYVKALRKSPGGPGTRIPSIKLFEQAFSDLRVRYDRMNGGFGNAPKFPMPHTLMFLMRYWKRTGSGQALEMAEKTLKMMGYGGIYDQAGYGFHRYSTDSRWLVPHFEKMLYDQALAVIAYCEAYQITKNPEYKRIARECLTYVEREMTSPDGGFYSAQDADSEGEEGRYYVWTRKETDSLFDPETASFVHTVYRITTTGNFSDPGTGERSGNNILHMTASPEEYAVRLGLGTDEFMQRLDDTRKRLFDERCRRTPPLKDDKILADWNGLMIAAFARAAMAFGESRYRHVAENAADFILLNMSGDDGGILHRYRQGKTGIRGQASDYAFLIWGLTELYQASFQLRYLKSATDLDEYFYRHFYDRKSPGYFNSDEQSGDLLVRQKDLYDGALPSANSVQLYNLVRLSGLTGESMYQARASEMVRQFSSAVSASPSSYTFYLAGLDRAAGPSQDVVIVGKRGAPDTCEMIEVIHRNFFPSGVVLFRDGEQDTDITAVAPFSEPMKMERDESTAYVCLGNRCNPPTTDVQKMRELLGI
jgi:uncharacterized protein YyaL (SSP411 family)